MLTLPSHHIHLWHIALDQTAEVSLMSHDEQSRYQDIKSNTKRQEYALCRIAVRQILSRYLNIPAKQITYQYNAQGKPRIDSPLHFNLSHAGNSAVLAIAQQPVGIDIEPSQRLVGDIALMAERFLHPQEAQWIAGHTANKQSEAFLHCWTANEAIVKAVGTGLSQQLQAFCVIDNQPVWLSPQAWYLYPLSHKSDLIGHIAYAQPNQDIMPFEFTVSEVTSSGM